MTRKLQEELQQTKPFESLEQEVYLQILRTSEIMSRWVIDALRAADLSAPQFNVLRILRGAGPAGLPSGRIAERMVNHDPDLTRLLDRLEARGMVEKTRDTKDRRVVNACITAVGLEACATATQAVREQLRRAMRPVAAARLERLADQLEDIRATGAKSLSNQTTDTETQGGSHGISPGSRTRHGSDRQAGRSDRARAGREGRARAGHDASSGVGRGAGDAKARRRDRRR